jgi:hypothetical protein
MIYQAPGAGPRMHCADAEARVPVHRRAHPGRRQKRSRRRRSRNASLPVLYSPLDAHRRDGAVTHTFPLTIANTTAVSRWHNVPSRTLVGEPME